MISCLRLMIRKRRQIERSRRGEVKDVDREVPGNWDGGGCGCRRTIKTLKTLKTSDRAIEVGDECI